MNKKSKLILANRNYIKQKWRPSGYCFGAEILEITGKICFGNDWTGQENLSFENPPPYLDLPSDMDISNTKEIIAFGLLHEHIKKNIKPIRDIRKNRPEPWQNKYDWLYRQSDREYCGATSKEEATELWLKVAMNVIKQNQEYAAGNTRVAHVHNILRTALFENKIQAKRINELIDMPNTFWQNDYSIDIFSLAELDINIIFNELSVTTFLKNTFKDTATEVPTTEKDKKEPLTILSTKRTRKTPWIEDVRKAKISLFQNTGVIPKDNEIIQETTKHNPDNYPNILEKRKNSKGEDVVWIKKACGKNDEIRWSTFRERVSRIKISTS